jgi:hypothetical protein
MAEGQMQATLLVPQPDNAFVSASTCPIMTAGVPLMREIAQVAGCLVSLAMPPLQLTWQNRASG